MRPLRGRAARTLKLERKGLGELSAALIARLMRTNGVTTTLSLAENALDLTARRWCSAPC